MLQNSTDDNVFSFNLHIQLEARVHPGGVWGVTASNFENLTAFI